MLRHLLRTVNLFDTAKSVLFLCFLAGCNRSGERGQVRGPVYYERDDPRSLDPALSTDVTTGEMIALVFDGLTQFDGDGRLLPALSDRWTADRTGQRYVFHLRAGVSFHDGRPVVAADVKRSFVRVLNPQAHGGRVWPLLPIAGAGEFAAGHAGDVRGIEVLGDTAVAFTLNQALAIFPKFLAMPVASVVPRDVPADFGQRPVGTGPWRFAAWQHPDWLKRKPALRDVYVALNNRRGPLRDARVRQAINHAINVPEILRTVWNGRGALAAGSIPPTLGGSDSSRRPYSYDTTEARRLLRAAGYPNGFSLQLWRSGTNVEMGRVAQAIQAQLAAVGIRVEIVSRDASSMREAVRKGDTDMAILDWWADYPDADNFLYPLFHSASFGPGGNYAFYSDRVTDSLIMVARRTVDQSAREALYARIDQRVFDAAPWLYLWFPVDLWAEHPSVDGWDISVIFNGQRWTKVRVTAGR